MAWLLSGSRLTKLEDMSTPNPVFKSKFIFSLFPIS